MIGARCQRADAMRGCGGWRTAFIHSYEVIFNKLISRRRDGALKSSRRESSHLSLFSARSLYTRSFLNLLPDASSARPLSRCLRIAHNFAVLAAFISLTSISRPCSACRFFLSLCLSSFLCRSPLPPVFLSWRPLYIVITIFILSLAPPFFCTPTTDSSPRRLARPSEFIKVSGVFSRN